MKKSELKSIIKECVKEILFDEGVLSNLVAEVAFGITKAQSQILESQKQETISPPPVHRPNSEKIEEEKRKKILETKRKMLDAIGSEKMKGVFEGTEPLRESQGQASAHSPLSGRDPSDAGIDITGIFNLAGHRWQNLK